MSREWVPISADPINGRSRLAVVARMVALHAAPCPECGKGSPLDHDDPQLVCQCGSAPRNWASACWSAAAALRDAHPDADRSAGWREATERSGWR